MWGSENASFQLPKSSGCRPNLWEWRVGEKISLDNDQWQWVVDCVRQPKKSNEQFDLPVRGASSNWIFKMVFPRRRKETLLSHECVALTRSEFLVSFCIPEWLNSYIEERCLLLRYPTHIFFSLSLILRERGHHELPVFSPLIFLRLLAKLFGETETSWVVFAR